MPDTKARKKEVDAYVLAVPTSWAPSFLEIKLAAPVPKVKPIAWNKAIMEKTIPTAALALVPSLETKKVSAVLYIAVTSMLIIVGTASLATSPGIGMVVILRCCVLLFS